MDAQQEAPQNTMCHNALPQSLEEYLSPIALPLFGTFFPMNYKKQVLLFLLKRLYLKLLSDPHSANALDLAINCPHY